MSHFKKIAASASLLAALTLCPISAQAAPVNSPSLEASITDSTQKLYDKAVDARQATRDWTRDTRHNVSDAWDDIGLKYKVHKIQSDVRPYGQDLRSKMGIVFTPVKKFLSWTDHYMSVAALMLILASLSVIGFMATAVNEDHH